LVALKKEKGPVARWRFRKRVVDGQLNLPFLEKEY
jgi:hypothetical protein